MAVIEQVPYLYPTYGALNRRASPVEEETSARSPLPMIFWDHGAPWREANVWALHQANGGASPKTILSNIGCLLAYANWLEATNTTWDFFPVREADRCLVRFRGFLISSIREQAIATSTASLRMGTVVRFYRWAKSSFLLHARGPMWNERPVSIRFATDFGLERTINVRSTNLSIPNRAREGIRLEGGVTPVSANSAASIMNFAALNCSAELSMMIRIGFRTGMRIGTISDLKVDTIARSLPDPQIPGWHRINVGPGAHPPVSTKFGVTGEILISDAEIKLLLNYIGSTQRLMRVAKAPGIHRDLVFLTRNGTPYFSSGARQGRALSMGIFRLRKLGAETKNSSVANFHFHQTRATFATELVKILLRVTNAETALGFVKDALLHKNESTTLKYIQFVERTEAVAACADAFTQDFLQIPLSAHQANDS